jgi:hypothetical protein
MNDDNLDGAIRKLVESVQPTHIFDSHFIIGGLVRQYPDLYLQFAAQFDAASVTMHQVHGKIALRIVGLERELNIERVKIEKVEPDSWSEAITGNPASCACWIKM